MKAITTPEELRAHLGMKEGQLLTNSKGEECDILSIQGEYAVLGILGRREPVLVKLCNILPKRPEGGFCE